MGALLAIALAVLAAIPAYVTRLTGAHDTLPVEISTLLYGMAIVGAAFAISWAAEAAEHDVPRSVALIAVALLALLPEYAVDIVFAYKAGQDPAFAPFAVANMTGSNRLLLGVGWPMVAVLAWFFGRHRVLHLDKTNTLPLAFLAVATLYAFTLPLKSGIAPIDSLILFALFGAYAFLASRQPTEEPELVGPAKTIGELPALQRRLAVLALFVFAGLTILMCAESFAEGLVHTGEKLGVDEFLLVQWLAPLASESPEFLIAALLAMRGKGSAGLALLLSGEVNQWLLLVGSLPIAYSVSSGHLAALPLDPRQTGEVLLTASMSLFGVAVLASMSLALMEASLLSLLFFAQLIIGGFLRAGLHSEDLASAELLWFSVTYVLLAVVFLIHAWPTLNRMFRPGSTKARDDRQQEFG